MNLLEALALGLVQGLTEFLPVSSSGHLVMAQTVLDVNPAGVFVEVVLHVATLLAVVVVYRRRLLELLLGAARREADPWRYLALLALATLPAAAVGLLFQQQIERAFDAPALTGAMLLVTGLLLWSTRYARSERVALQPGWAGALGIGVAQAFAILPGISRSGATITAGLWSRLRGDRAAEFSFLMSIPAILGAAILEFDEMTASVRDVGTLPLLLGFAAALVSGVTAIYLLLWLTRLRRFYAFAYYVWLVGGLFLIFLASRA